MLIPAAMKQLNEAHAALGQSARQNAVCGKRARLARVRAVALQNCLRLRRQIRQLGNRRLHAISHLVLRHAREDFGITEQFRHSFDSALRDRQETGGALVASIPGGFDR